MVQRHYMSKDQKERSFYDPFKAEFNYLFTPSIKVIEILRTCFIMSGENNLLNCLEK